MNSLIRNKQGKFNIDDAINLEDINESTKLLKCNDVLDVEEYNVDEKIYKLVINGNKLNKAIGNGFYNIVYNEKGIALYKFVNNEGRLVMFY